MKTKNFGPKIDQFPKKKKKMQQKNKLRLSLRRKKFSFVQKIGENFENKVQKGPILKKKKDFLGQKKQAGAELGQKVGKKI